MGARFFLKELKVHIHRMCNISTEEIAINVSGLHLNKNHWICHIFKPKKLPWHGKQENDIKKTFPCPGRGNMILDNEKSNSETVWNARDILAVEYFLWKRTWTWESANQNAHRHWAISVLQSRTLSIHTRTHQNSVTTATVGVFFNCACRNRTQVKKWRTRGWTNWHSWEYI